MAVHSHLGAAEAADRLAVREQFPKPRLVRVLIRVPAARCGNSRS